MKRTSGTGTSSKSWTGIVDPDDYYYYVRTYAHKGLAGSSTSKATVVIYPYFDLDYQEVGGQGRVKFYVNGSF